MGWDWGGSRQRVFERELVSVQREGDIVVATAEGISSLLRGGNLVCPKTGYFSGFKSKSKVAKAADPQAGNVSSPRRISSSRICYF